MPKLPNFETTTNTSHSPHVLILGAGASLAALPYGDHYERKLPLMTNLVETINLQSIMEEHGIKYESENFESLYDRLANKSIS